MTKARNVRKRNVILVLGACAQAGMIYWFQQTPGGAPLWFQIVTAVLSLAFMWAWMNRMIRDALRLEALAEFVREYCEQRGWDADSLEPEQLRTIAAQPEWEAIARA